MDERGKTQKRRRTTVTVVALILLLLWVMAACALSAAAADGTTVLLSLRSKLTADYGGDAGMKPLSTFRLSIITDAMRDHGMGESAADHEQALKSMMDKPVPTATARNFEGEAPSTPTSSPHPPTVEIPTTTPSPTTSVKLPSSSTPSNTPRPTKPKEVVNPPSPSASSEPTSTTLPSDTPAPTSMFTPTGTWTSPPPSPSPTFTPTETSPPSPEDELDPIIEDWQVDPAPGPVGTCSVQVGFNNIEVRDPRHSEGIDWARLKYNVNGRGCYSYSNHLNRTSTSLSCIDGRCEIVATFNGHIDIDLEAYYASGNCGPWPEEDDEFVIRLWIQARDNVGHQNQALVGAYRLPDDECGED
jgi:hypothetical protein